MHSLFSYGGLYCIIALVSIITSRSKQCDPRLMPKLVQIVAPLVLYYILQRLISNRVTKIWSFRSI